MPGRSNLLPDTGVNETLSFDRVYFAHWYRRAAGYVDRVLEEKLAGLPVLAPTSDQPPRCLASKSCPRSSPAEEAIEQS